MTVWLGALYHWSPIEARAGIRRRGLRPRTDTAVAIRPAPTNAGHFYEDVEAVTIRAVCLGTTPAIAWSLSGVWTAKAGDVWDCWEVNLANDDEVHVLPVEGNRLDEVRVLGPIPRGRIWHVGARTVGRLHWYHAP